MLIQAGVLARAALLEHRGHGLRHYDLLWAHGARCLTLRLSLGPPWQWTWSFPHRRRYLTYAGPVAGGRGVVYRRWRGTVRVVGRRLVPGAGFPLGLRIVHLPPGP